ncbi:MAG TPA: sialate O-acetylesterase, partial [Chitinophagaceae bacterium]|nr:sialate O-acetylesterase [Chitinophagaceae bacterium]
MKKIISTCILLLLQQVVSAQIKLPRLVRDSMVLQRDTKVNIWGCASPNEDITASINGKNYRTKADGSGNWSLQLAPMKAGGPYTMDITGKNKISLKDVLVGDVWFCSGQSNMVHQMNIHDVAYAKDIAEANNPLIRQFWIPTLTSLQGPQTDLPNGFWKSAVGDDVRPFSAVAYFFARKIYQQYKIPIGIINASVGGTPIEAWTSEEGLQDFSVLAATIQKNKDTAYLNSLNRRPSGSVNRPAPP